MPRVNRNPEVAILILLARRVQNLYYRYDHDGHITDIKTQYKTCSALVRVSFRGASISLQNGRHIRPSKLAGQNLSSLRPIIRRCPPLAHARLCWRLCLVHYLFIEGRKDRSYSYTHTHVACINCSCAAFC